MAAGEMPGDLPVAFLAVFAQKMLHQQRNVPGAFPQGRQMDGDDAEAVKEVFAEGAGS